MTTIGTAVLKLKAETGGFGKQVDAAEKKTSKLRGALKGAAGQVPVFGGALSAMVSPTGAATAAVGALVVGLGAAVTKITAVEKELRPMIQRSGIAGEQLQVLARTATALGSQDGLEGVADSSQELQLRLAEVVQDGTGPAVAAFEKLGLSAEALIDKSPEQSFRDTITALQGVTNEADRKFLADELMGGSSEKLAGIINATAEDFNALTSSISQQADIVSNEGLESAREFSRQMTQLKTTMGGVATSVGEALLPVLVEVIEVIRGDIIPILRDVFVPIWEALKPALVEVADVFRRDLLPALKTIWDSLGPVLIPALKVLTSIIGATLVTAVRGLAAALQTVSAILTGDWSAAWQGIKKMVLNSLEGVIRIYNATIGKLPGMAEVDLEAVREKFEEVETATSDVGDAAVEMGSEVKSGADTATRAMDATRIAAQQATEEMDRWVEANVEGNKQIAQAAKDAAGITEHEYQVAQRSIERMTAEHYADLVRMAEDQGIEDLALLKAQLDKAEEARKLAQWQEKQNAIAAAREKAEALKAENARAAEEQLEQDRAQWAITEVEYALAKVKLQTISSEHYAALLMEAEEAGVKDLALLLAHEEKRLAEVYKANQAELAAEREASAERVMVVEEGLARQEVSIASSMERSVAAVASSAAAITASIAAIPSEKTITISTIHTVTGSAGGVTGEDDQGGELSTGVTLHGDGTGTVSTGNTGGEGGPGSESSQGFSLDDSGNAYYDDAHQNPVDDDTQDAIDEVLGHNELARGGIVPARAGGWVARLGEAGVPEAVIPLRGGGGGMLRMRRHGMGGGGQIIVQGDVYGYDDFAEKVAQAGNSNSRAGIR